MKAYLCQIDFIYVYSQGKSMYIGKKYCHLVLQNTICLLAIGLNPTQSGPLADLYRFAKFNLFTVLNNENAWQS
jgi:hypothetical protein